jgi:hypothetical protein
MAVARWFVHGHPSSPSLKNATKNTLLTLHKTQPHLLHSSPKHQNQPGIKREGEIVSATARTADDGREYYDLSIRMASYASRNPYVATQAEVMTQYGLEWDRRLSTTLGVANGRLYELRLQSKSSEYEAAGGGAAGVVAAVQQSFRVREVEA